MQILLLGGACYSVLQPRLCSCVQQAAARGQCGRNGLHGGLAAAAAAGLSRVIVPPSGTLGSTSVEDVCLDLYELK